MRILIDSPLQWEVPKKKKKKKLETSFKKKKKKTLIIWYSDQDLWLMLHC